MKNIQNQKLYVIYSRKSKFTGKGESIETQIDLCKKYLVNKYGNIEEKIQIFQDEGFTGYNTNRPQFQKMMQFIKENKVKCVIVYRLDRISRNVSDFCNLKNEFTKYNVSFISVTENFDTTTPLGSAMIMISSVFSQLERDTIAERIRDNMYELAKTGRWLGGTTPFGYKSKKTENLSLDGKKKSLYKLEIIPEEERIIKLIWDKMIELKGLSKLESYLLQQGIKTRNGNNFTRFSLITILKNPVYVIADEKVKLFFNAMGVNIYGFERIKITNNYGLIAYNKREEIRRKTKSYKNISEWIIAVGKHHGIISSNEFIEVWNIIENNKNKRFRTPQINKSILSGIIKCKYCGSYMRPRLRNSATSNGKRNFSYLCEMKDKSRKKLCKCKNINGIEVDKLVFEKIKDLTLSTSYLVEQIKLSINNKQKYENNNKNELNTLNVNMVKNKEKIKSLLDKISIIDIDLVNDIALKIKELKTKNIKISEKIAELTKKMNQEICKEKILSIALNIIDKYLYSFDTLDITEKRIMIKSLVDSIESDGKNVYINYIGSFNTIVCPRGDGSRSCS